MPVTSAGPGSGGVCIRAGRTDDAAFVGTLHAAAISDGFLSGLGPRFLAVLYRRIVLDPGSFLLVAEGNDTTPVGFIAGTCEVGRLYRRFILHDGLRAVMAAPRRLLASWRSAMETLRYGSRVPERAPDTSGAGPEAELLSVAVADAGRGRGIGAALVEAFLEELGRRGVRRAVVVVGADNQAAVAMYCRSGFGDEEDLELHPGIRSLRLAWSAPRDTSA